MVPIEDLLKPVSAAEPAGKELRDQEGDPVAELEELIAPHKPEVNWEDVSAKAVELLNRSKDLRVAIVLCLAALKEEGLAGFKEGLELLKGLLKDFWPGLFPSLPADGKADRRVIVLGRLSAEFSGHGPTAYKFITFLSEVPLFQPKDSAPVSFKDLGSATPAAAGVSETKAPGLDPERVKALLGATPPEELTRGVEGIKSIESLLNDIDELLTQKVGEGGPDVDFKKLRETLREMRELLTARSAATAGKKNQGGGGTPLKDGPAAPGTIGSADAVVEVLERVCQYYKDREPSSPVPLLLRRAQRLAKMDFWKIIGDLTPGALDELKKIAGEVKEHESQEDKKQ